MDAGSLIGLVVTLLVVVVSLGITLLVTVVSFAIPVAIMIFVAKRIASGQGTIVVSGPLAAALASQTTPKPDGPLFVKRTRCRDCGAPKVQRSLNAYVYCDFCGALVDWDFQACLADKRSRLPGPAYENLLRQLGPKIEAAKSSGDRDEYRAVQLKIWDAYATVCPAALPPRIGDPAFRNRFVEWQADAQTEMDLDPGTAATVERQNATVQALAWDRSNPFQPRIQPGSFDTLLDAVLAHQKACSSLLASTGLLATHPDHPTEELMQHIGVSALVQGWIPYFKEGETDRVLVRTGLKDEYDEVAPPEMKSGPCPSCGAPLEVVEGAKRVLCYACGHLAGVGTGTLPCHGCGTPVTLPDSGSLLDCPSCDAELRLMRWS